MNKLSVAARVQILNLLVEGASMRSISRVCDVSLTTVIKLLVDVGPVCEAFHNATVRGLQTRNLQCDEIWSFCYAKDRTVKAMPEDKVIPGAGNVWTFTAIDRDSKLIVSWFAGDRDGRCADAFLRDTAARIDTPVQVSTDGWVGYTELVSEIFPLTTSYGQVQKVFSSTPNKGPANKYSPGVVVAAKRETIFGNTDHNAICTSHVERQNLTMRMSMRRFTRLSNGFSKKIDNHSYALALYFFHYNFCRLHKSLRTTPAQAAGLTDEVLGMEHLCALMDAQNAPKKRGAYKKKMAA